MFSDPIRNSEVGLIVAAAVRLQEQGIAVRCVWMPSAKCADNSETFSLRQMLQK